MKSDDIQRPAVGLIVRQGLFFLSRHWQRFLLQGQCLETAAFNSCLSAFTALPVARASFRFAKESAVLAFICLSFAAAFKTSKYLSALACTVFSLRAGRPATACSCLYFAIAFVKNHLSEIAYALAIFLLDRAS